MKYSTKKCISFYQGAKSTRNLLWLNSSKHKELQFYSFILPTQQSWLNNGRTLIPTNECHIHGMLCRNHVLDSKRTARNVFL